jgi:hypothetical protein
MRCKHCGNLSHAPGSPNGQLLVSNAAVVTLAGFLGIYLHSAFPLVAAALLALFRWALRLHKQPFLRVSQEQVRLARASEGLGAAVLLWLMGSQ